MVERMGDLPEFMRVLKQTFTCWYNAKEGRKGTLWDARYRSVVVEGNPLALLSVAAYIDLNPVRAGLVVDPVESVWSGYGSACGGDSASRKGLDLLVRCSRGCRIRRCRCGKQLLKESDKGWGGGRSSEEGATVALRKARTGATGPPQVGCLHRNDGTEDPQSQEKFRGSEGDRSAGGGGYKASGKCCRWWMLHQRMRWLTGIGKWEVRSFGGSDAGISRMLRSKRKSGKTTAGGYPGGGIAQRGGCPENEKLMKGSTFPCTRVRIGYH